MFKFAGSTNHGVTEFSLSALLYHPVTEAFDLDYPGKNPSDYPWLVGFINGLICLAISLSEGLHDLFLWNPSIRKYKKLPNIRLDVSPRSYLDEWVDFKFGFAYDEVQDDYKVVGIFPIERRGHLSHIEVKIYSLKCNSWRRISTFQGREFLHVPGKLVNGKLHWLDEGWNISSIDLGTEKWVEIEKPCNFKDYGHFVLGVLGSDLSMLCYYTWSHADIFVMKEYRVKESWTKMFTSQSLDDFMSHIHHPLLISNEGDILLEIGSRLAKYDPKDKSIRYLDVTNFTPSIEAEIYIKSLVCPFLQKRPRMQKQRKFK